MHDHDLDLIAAYADGSLDGPDDEARRLVESCGPCRDEYDLQREIRTLLAEAPAAALTGEERARTRSAVFEAVGGRAPVVDLGTRRTRRWMAIGSAAATVLVLAGLAGALGVLRGADSGGSGDTATFARSEEAGDAAGEDNPHMMLTPETTVAAATESGAVAPLELGPVSLEELKESVAREIERLEQGGTVADRSNLTDSDLECAQRLPAPALEEMRAVVGGEQVVVYLTRTDTGVSAAGYRVEGCVALALD